MQPIPSPHNAMCLTYRTTPVLLAWAASAPLLCALPGPAASQPARAPWRTPPARLRTEAGDAVYVDQPRAARVGGRVALFGFPTLAVGAQGLTAFGAGVTLTSGRTARVIPLPPGQRRFRSPAVATTFGPTGAASGVAHVVWSGRDTPEPGEPDTLWYARWDGSRWSTPERVWTGPDLRWDQDVQSDLLESAGALDVFVGYTPPEAAARASGSLLHLTRRAGRWRGSVIPLPSGPTVQVVAQYTADRSAYVVGFIGAARLPGDPAPPRLGSGELWTVDRNSVFAGRLALGGTELSDLVRVHAGRSAPAMNVAMRSDADGRITLAWVANRDGQDAPGRWLTAAQTTDAGRTWQPGSAVDLGGAVTRVRVAASTAQRFTATAAVTREQTPTPGRPNPGAPPDGRAHECLLDPSRDGGSDVAVTTLPAGRAWRVRRLPIPNRTTPVAVAGEGRLLVLWTGGDGPGGLPYTCTGAI